MLHRARDGGFRCGIKALWLRPLIDNLNGLIVGVLQNKGKRLHLRVPAHGLVQNFSTYLHRAGAPQGGGEVYVRRHRTGKCPKRETDGETDDQPCDDRPELEPTCPTPRWR